MCCDFVILVCDEVMCQGILFVLSVHIIWAIWVYVCVWGCHVSVAVVSMLGWFGRK